MRRFLLFLLVFIGGMVYAQLHNPAQFRVEQHSLSDREMEIVFTGTVEQGWHVYGADIAEGGPTRAELTLEKLHGLKPIGVLTATGRLQHKMDELFGMEVSYMEGVAKFVQRFQIMDSSYEMEGYLTYGVCNDKNCLPPTNVEFSFKGTTPSVSSKEEGNPMKIQDPAPSSLNEIEEYPHPSDSLEVPAHLADGERLEGSLLWKPVIDELKAFSNDADSPLNGNQRGLLWIFLLGLLGGFAALLTPCVWPIIPMTVSFFLKRNKDDRRQGVHDAITYGLSIIAIYMALGLIVTMLFGASALNAMSTNAVFNIFFFLLLVFFAVSFFGGFEITLPSSWSNAVDAKAMRTTGLLSIFLMAFTLALVSFSCTGPIIGFLLVEIAGTGNWVGPAVGMLGFSVALALPFTLFALFPSWLKRAPKSGEWMNCVKVCLGFIELAFSLKFLSVADLAYGWGVLPRELFFVLWIIIFGLMGIYLMGWMQIFSMKRIFLETKHVFLFRVVLAIPCFVLVAYLIPGLWGAPCKAVSAFAPPMKSSLPLHFTDYEEGMMYAKSQNKPVLLDFTGYGCVNCRKMEAAVWTSPQVQRLMAEEYVVISLYVDDKTPLPTPMIVKENGEQYRLRSIGDKWSYLQRYKFGANAQPFYVLVNSDGCPLNSPYGFDEDVNLYIKFLKTGLSNL